MFDSVIPGAVEIGKEEEDGSVERFILEGLFYDIFIFFFVSSLQVLQHRFPKDIYCRKYIITAAVEVVASNSNKQRSVNIYLSPDFLSPIIRRCLSNIIYQKFRQ